ncbi:MAG: aminodeoxychorismate/anthranilate synthase component II [Vibrio sp.]
MAQIIFLDNFDSFTYNLVDQFRSLGHEVTIYRNQIGVERIQASIAEKQNPILVLSPGPGKPSDAGCMPEVIQTLKGQVPMLGICLGHQAIVESYGGIVAGAGEIVHGKTSIMTHTGHRIFNDLPETFAIARYHSLVATKLSDTLELIAEVDKLPMAVINENDKICGFQFHPESLMTTYGATLLQNAIDWALDKPSN